MQNLHQSWGLVMLCVGIVLGMILGVILRINYFGAWWWVLLVIGVFVLMYLKPRFLTVGMCLIAGMVLAFFRVTVVLASDAEVELGVDAGTEELVASTRGWLAERIELALPKREAKLGMSYLLGMKNEIDKELSKNLKAVGLTHIVVASGAHLSILVGIARKIFGRISRFSGLLFSVLFILFFMCMVGWTPSILRAGVMSILTLFSWYVGRKIAPWRLILMTAAFTLMLNPMFLMSLGWLLSFASYAGIMILGPELSRFFYREKKPGFLASVILTTVAATLMTLPITLYYFGQVSLISVMANLLILPTLSYAMGLVFLAGIFYGLPGVGMMVGFLAEKILDFHISVVEWFGEMEQFLIQIDLYEPRVFLLYLTILVPMIWRGVKWFIDKRKRLDYNCE
ncbi:ComEC/Rec2 family competence protein [Candidatus Saccharibacteria bacterium]|nr:ComEC/Rec2 family competence protein [Candidatus Saccharibacteria bacterium]